MTEERPNTAPKTPLIFAIWAGGKTSAMTAKVDAKSTPPKAPWRPRNSTSSNMFWDIPQRADAAMKPIMPAIRKGLRPNMSPSLPATGTSAVEVMR